LPLMDDLVRANTECCILLRPLGTKPLGPESPAEFCSFPHPDKIAYKAYLVSG
jgi:hypothetical protein